VYPPENVLEYSYKVQNLLGPNTDRTVGMILPQLTTHTVKLLT